MNRQMIDHDRGHLVVIKDTYSTDEAQQFKRKAFQRKKETFQSSYY